MREIDVMRKEIDEVVRSGTKTDREMVDRFEAAHRKAVDDFRRISDARKEEAAVEARRHENAKNQIETAREQALMRENKKYEDNMRKLNAPRDKASDERTSALSASTKAGTYLPARSTPSRKMHL